MRWASPLSWWYEKMVRFCAQCIVKNGEKWNDGSEGLRYGDLTYGKLSFLRRNIYKVL